MVRVEAGEDLVESLMALATAAGWQEAFVSGAGVLELVELATGHETLTLENAELTSLAGRIRRQNGEVFVVLRATVTVGGEPKSGRIEAAMTGGLLLVVDAISEAVRARDVAPPAASREHSREQTLSPPPPAAFDGARAASKPMSQSFTTKPIVHKRPTRSFEEEENEENPVVNPGDYLSHPQLGLCEVVGDDDTGGTRIRLESGRLRVLKLEHLKVVEGELDEQGRRVFRVIGPRRR